MTNYNSGIKITEVRVSNFRSLKDVVVKLDDITLLIGANNAGKTNFLDAISVAIGSYRQILNADDIYIGPDEKEVSKDRKAVIDIFIRPTDSAGNVIDAFPAAGFWTGHWGDAISQDESMADFIGIRSMLLWSPVNKSYRLERRFLKDLVEPPEWIGAAEKGP